LVMFEPRLQARSLKVRALSDAVDRARPDVAVFEVSAVLVPDGQWFELRFSIDCSSGAVRLDAGRQGYAA
jgi:hypothetical protein